MFDKAQYHFDQNFHHHAKTPHEKNLNNGLSHLAFALKDMMEKIESIDRRLAALEKKKD